VREREKERERGSEDRNEIKKERSRERIDIHYASATHGISVSVVSHQRGIYIITRKRLQRRVRISVLTKQPSSCS
jgi:hypothetical protein